MIVTLTMNPTIDISTTVEEVAPYRKLRGMDVRRDPGGGGINVARVARRLGEDVTAIYPAGGAIGALLHRLVDAEGIVSVAVPVQDDTRESFTAFERKSGLEYRFVLPGPHLSAAEGRQCLDAIEALDGPLSFFVISGSLPPGIHDDFYATAAALARRKGARIAADTSGPPLRALIDAGVDLIKPNRRELQDFVARPLEDRASQIEAGRDVVARGQARMVALSLADKGALLVTRDGAWAAAAPPVTPVSTVGAGDSFLAAMAVALTRGDDEPHAFRRAVAAGTAALLSPGTELCRPGDIDRLLPLVEIEALEARSGDS